MALQKKVDTKQQNISNAIAGSGLPVLDLAANQVMFADALTKEAQAVKDALK